MEQQQLGAEADAADAALDKSPLPDQEDCYLKFFVTAGRGTEPFAKLEIDDKLSPNPLETVVGNGKVFFSLTGPLTLTRLALLRNLKTVERLFVQVVATDCGINNSGHTSDASCVSAHNKGKTYLS